jgi:SAM-dependent methyltransferase
MSQTVRWNEFVDTGARVELERLTLLEEIFDPFSVRNLDRFGVGPGWRCLEVGAGAGSVARHLAQRAGHGNVVATDVSTEFLAPLAEIGVRVVRHDVTADDAPGEFDLIHTRFVLEHLATRDAVLRRMVSWLRPGGVLLVEAATNLPELSSHPAVRRALDALGIVLSQTIGTNPTWARTLPLPLEKAGLTGCEAEGLVLPARGGSPLAGWLKATHKLIEAPAVATGVITQEELDEAYATYDSPSFVDYSWLAIGAWGRRD